jgi:hypothetical protein
MSDRAPIQLYVYDCPPEQRAAVKEIIDNEYLSFDWGSGDSEGELRLDGPYTDDDMVLGAEGEIAAAIIKAAPDCTFNIWQDPKYEYMGAGISYTPDLGEFRYVADADGNPTFIADQIAEICEMPPEERDKALGKPWTERFRQFRTQEAVLDSTHSSSTTEGTS